MTETASTDRIDSRATLPAEDGRIARLLFGMSIGGSLLAIPMFLARFEMAVRLRPEMQISVAALMGIELAKIATLSFAATWIGKHLARPAGIQSPALSALIHDGVRAAARVLRRSVPRGIGLGIVAFIVRGIVSAPIEGVSISDYFARKTYEASALVQTTGVFYIFAVSVWSRWGAIALASRAVAVMIKLPPSRRFFLANILTSVVFGLIAIPAVWGAHSGEHDSWRYVLSAILGRSLAAFIVSMAIRRRGFETAAVADGTTFLGATVIPAVVALFG